MEARQPLTYYIHTEKAGEVPCPRTQQQFSPTGVEVPTVNLTIIR